MDLHFSPRTLGRIFAILRCFLISPSRRLCLRKLLGFLLACCHKRKGGDPPIGLLAGFPSTQILHSKTNLYPRSRHRVKMLIDWPTRGHWRKMLVYADLAASPARVFLA